LFESNLSERNLKYSKTDIHIFFTWAGSMYVVVSSNLRRLGSLNFKIDNFYISTLVYLHIYINIFVHVCILSADSL
jgi:hypothetical protein